MSLSRAAAQAVGPTGRWAPDRSSLPRPVVGDDAAARARDPRNGDPIVLVDRVVACWSS